MLPSRVQTKVVTAIDYSSPTITLPIDAQVLPGMARERGLRGHW
jgi:hypothetical protein